MGFRFDDVKKQSQLAAKLGTSEVTTRKSYREWLTDFPDLFVDVIGKLAKDNNMKYFVLIDLKQIKQSIQA